jgi:hypothetical protein
MRGIGAVLAGMTATLVGSLASAYVRTKGSDGRPLAWPNPSVSFLLAPVPASLGVPATDVLAVAQRAAATWSRQAVACTAMQVTVLQGGPGTKASDPASNVIAFYDQSWCPDGQASGTCYQASAPAITSLLSRTTSGAIVGADIELNAVAFRWSVLTAATGATGTFDIESVLTAEIGHALGLSSVCRADGTANDVDDRGQPVPTCSTAPASLRTALLFGPVRPGEVRRNLSADESRAMCEIYPARGTPASADARPGGPSDAGSASGTAASHGGCTVAQRSSGPTGIGVGVLLWAGRRVVRAPSRRRRRR